MTNVVRAIAESWGWSGIDPVEVVGDNDFGNLIVKDQRGRYWRIQPEHLSCLIVAESRSALTDLSTNQTFLRDWYMTALVEKARNTIGELGPGRKFYFVTPPVLGGEYDVSNIRTLSQVELIRLSGDLAEQVKNLPDGAQVELKVVE